MLDDSVPVPQAEGALIAVTGAIVTIVYQARRSCPHEDSPSVCAMIPADATVMTIAMFGTLICLVILVLGLLARPANPIR